MWRHHTQRMTSYISVKCTSDNGKKPRVWGQCHLWKWSALGRNTGIDPTPDQCFSLTGVWANTALTPTVTDKSGPSVFTPPAMVTSSPHPQWWRHYPYTITCVWRNADLKSPLASCVDTTQYCALRHRSVCMSVAQGSVRINYSPPSEININ